MAINKFKNERSIISFFLVVAIGVFGVSLWFLLTSIKKDELGGSFISAMLLFISGYGSIVFVARAIRYAFLTKLQKAILVENIVEVSELEVKFGKNEKQIKREIEFMINSGYLEDYKLYDNRLISASVQRATMDRLREKQAQKQKELENVGSQQQENSDKKSQKKQKDVIKSEKCPNCGAKIKFNSEKQTSCPYCGNNLTKD